MPTLGKMVTGCLNAVCRTLGGRGRTESKWELVPLCPGTFFHCLLERMRQRLTIPLAPEDRRKIAIGAALLSMKQELGK